MSLYASLTGRGPSGFGYASTAEEVTDGLDLRGRRILLTGCNSGLGAESMRVLAARGATVLGAARSIEKAREACEAVTGDTIPVACDLSEPESVRACVATVKALGPLDVILCNAGVMALPTLERKYGYELQFFTNHVGHFLLVTGLLDALTPTARVVMLSSGAHKAAPPAGIAFDNLNGERGYAAWAAYGQAKLANLLFARELALRFAGTTKVANALHPGVIATNLGRHMNPAVRLGLTVMRPLFMKSTPQGAATQCWAAAHPDAGRHNGAYFSDCNVAKSSPYGEDARLAAALWARTEEIVAALP